MQGQENVIYNEKTISKNQPRDDTDVRISSKDVKIVIKAVFHMFKMVSMSRVMGDIKGL